MPKVKEAWRFRKQSGGDPIHTLDCGCKVWIYDGTVVRYCAKHYAQQFKAGRALNQKELLS